MLIRTLAIASLGLVLCCKGQDSPTKPDPTKPDATKPDATKPDATKPDATKPDATKPDATKVEASKAANARGMALMGKKRWAEAAAEFKQAITDNPASIKAHYNLASAASRAHDSDTALWELAWVGDRAAWDNDAKAAADKALTRTRVSTG